MFEQLIPSFTNLVFLFMMVSGFGMCCGYYQKFKDQKISVGEFYAKRYSKIWPYLPNALQSAAKKEELTAASPFFSMVGTTF